MNDDFRDGRHASVVAEADVANPPSVEAIDCDCDPDMGEGVVHLGHAGKPACGAAVTGHHNSCPLSKVRWDGLPFCAGCGKAFCGYCRLLFQKWDRSA